MPHSGQRKSILIVEDHPDSANMLARGLVRIGHDVQVALNVSQARILAASHEFDIALCDLGLPDGDGCDLMRELFHQHKIKGIALSGYGGAEDFQRTRDAGFSAHIQKPIAFDRLLELLDAVAPAPIDGAAAVQHPSVHHET